MVSINCTTEDHLELDQLTEFQGGLKNRTDGDYAKIIVSIQKYGFSFPFFVWNHDGINHVLDGHGRLGALKKLKAQGEVIPPLPVVYVNCGNEENAKNLLLRLNSQYGQMTAESVMDFMAGLEFDPAELALPEGVIDFNLEEQEKVEDDDIPEPETELPAISKPGEIYQLGPHRLMCGDSTKEEDMQKLMDGQKADLIVTDPPYNVNYGAKGKTYKEHGGYGCGMDDRTILNDNMDDSAFLQFLTDAFKAMFSVLKAGGAYYVWHADSEGYNFRLALRNTGAAVKQCLIWVKNSLVLGRQDWQWRHEPCQPAGTQVLTIEGYKPIESLTENDRVISFDSLSGQVKGYKNGGYAIKTASRDYDGLMYTIRCDGRITRATDNHQFSVRFNPKSTKKYCTYLMRRGNWWRVGMARAYDARQFGLKTRIHQEHGEEAWVISVHDDKTQAQVMEQILTCKYGIPYTVWETTAMQRKMLRTDNQVGEIYSALDLEAMQKNAERLLADFGRNIKYPLVSRENSGEKFSTRVTAKINACNLVPGIMQLPIPEERGVYPSFKWQEIEGVEFEHQVCKVYSLAVDKYEHYIADGLITHNCLYGWKEGSAHYWDGRRDLTTVIDKRPDYKRMDKSQLLQEIEKLRAENIPGTIIYEDRPTRSEDHPTMKPVKLFMRLIKNSSKEEDIVLDPFGGSGTTIIASQRLKRCARLMELDPHYCDVIRRRWTQWCKENGVEPGEGALE